MKKHMKKILHLGCSFSQYNHEGKHGVPENVVDVLKEKSINVRYYSASHGGCDVGTQFEILKSEIKNNYDFIIFQITNDKRKHIRINAKQLKWTPSETYQNIYKCDMSVRDNFVFWNPNYEQIINGFWPRHASRFKEIAKNSYLYDCDDQSIYFSYICAIKKILEQCAIPHLIYTHCTPYWEVHHVVFNEFINSIVDFDVQTELKENFNKFIYDGGHHFDNEGNRIVAENLIVPRILPYL